MRNKNSFAQPRSCLRLLPPIHRCSSGSLNDLSSLCGTTLDLPARLGRNEAGRDRGMLDCYPGSGWTALLRRGARVESGVLPPPVRRTSAHLLTSCLPCLRAPGMADAAADSMHSWADEPEPEPAQPSAHRSGSSGGGAVNGKFGGARRAPGMAKPQRPDDSETRMLIQKLQETSGYLPASLRLRCQAAKDVCYFGRRFRRRRACCPLPRPRHPTPPASMLPRLCIW